MNQLAVVLVVVLFPGIIAATIANKLTVHSRWDSFKFALYAFVLGVLTYASLQLGVYAADLFNSWCSGTRSWRHLAIWMVAQDGSTAIPPWEIATAVFLSVPLAFVVSAGVQYKVLTRVGNWLRVTTKYGDENLYTYFLNVRDTDWVYVRDKENSLTYEGRVVAFSENDDVHELVLHDVVVYRYEDSSRLYAVPTVYLSKPTGRFVIETVPSEKLQREI